ncbi:cytidylyltransferase domain-containing protein, partial [Campylobacter jejuni]
MKFLALLQARTSSTRLPGKVLKPLLGTPMILRQLERLERSRLINQI